VSNSVEHRARQQRRRRRRWRARPAIALAAVAFLVGALVGAGHSSPAARNLAARFASAWARRDYATMYSDIDPSSQRRLSVSDFADAYAQADATATATGLQLVGRPREVEGQTQAQGPAHTQTILVPVRVHTLMFGTLSTSFRLPIEGHGEGVRIAWSRRLLFPGLRRGEQLSRNTTLPARATLLARDGSVLAEGAATAAGERSSPLGSTASAVIGSVGAIPAARRELLEGQGVPAGAIVGVSGLELALDDRLRGSPGGELLAGQRVLASVAPRAAAPVRTTISPSVQRAAVAALGGQYGGVVALEPSSGQILAVAGIGLDDLQPPGSTFKMITLTAALQAGLAHPSSTFPYQTATSLDGVKLSNAHGESCGGTLALAFAVSCNSVFAPLGVKIGATRLVATAERFGFNQSPGIVGAVTSTIPAAKQIQGELAVGSTAIGQGEVQASALQMATVAATIADGGRRPEPTFTPTAGAVALAVRAMSSSVAHTVRRLMIGVVREGTGTSAAIPNVTVAGKTGTAELGNPTSCSSAPSGSASGESSSEESHASESESGSGSGSGECLTKNDPRSTDAWFAAFAPALRPRIVVGVLLVRDGAGGETAAPVARQVLLAGLQTHG
jgi:penicillin-binding protein A